MTRRVFSILRDEWDIWKYLRGMRGCTKRGSVDCGKGGSLALKGRRRQVSQEGAETSCRSRVGMPETTPPPNEH
jgi:hypothetical protein